jgi:hypothetical protein
MWFGTSGGGVEGRSALRVALEMGVSRNTVKRSLSQAAPTRVERQTARPASVGEGLRPVGGPPGRVIAVDGRQATWPKWVTCGPSRTLGACPSASRTTISRPPSPSPPSAQDRAQGVGIKSPGGSVSDRRHGGGRRRTEGEALQAVSPAVARCCSAALGHALAVIGGAGSLAGVVAAFGRTTKSPCHHTSSCTLRGYRCCRSGSVLRKTQASARAAG